MSGQMLVSDYNLVTSAFSLENGRGGSSPGTRLNRFFSTVTSVQLTPGNSNPRWFPSYIYCNFTLGNSNPRWLEPPPNSKLFVFSAVLINQAFLLYSSVFKISTYLLMRFKGSSMKLVFLPYLDPISFLLVICFELPTILELFSISLEGSIELPGVDCTYYCKSR